MVRDRVAAVRARFAGLGDDAAKLRKSVYSSTRASSRADQNSWLSGLTPLMRSNVVLAVETGNESLMGFLLIHVSPCPIKPHTSDVIEIACGNQADVLLKRTKVAATGRL